MNRNVYNRNDYVTYLIKGSDPQPREVNVKTSPVGFGLGSKGLCTCHKIGLSSGLNPLLHGIVVGTLSSVFHFK